MRDLRRAAHFAPLASPHTPNPARVLVSPWRAARPSITTPDPLLHPSPHQAMGPILLLFSTHTIPTPPHLSPYLCPDQMPMLDFSQLTALYRTGDQLVPGAAMRNLDAASLSARLPQITRPLCAPADRRPRPPFPFPSHPTVTPHPASPHPTLLLLPTAARHRPRSPAQPSQAQPTSTHPTLPSAWQHAACPSVASHRRSARVPRPTWREESAPMLRVAELS